MSLRLPQFAASWWRASVIFKSKLRPQRARRRILTFRADALVLRDDLRAKQQQGRTDLETQEHDDRGRQRPIDDTDLGQRPEIPDQDVARYLPEHRRGDGADQGVPP